MIKGPMDFYYESRGLFGVKNHGSDADYGEAMVRGNKVLEISVPASKFCCKHKIALKSLFKNEMSEKGTQEVQ